MVKPGTNLTVWGMLSLEENPTMPEDVKGLGDAISAKVPRIITLRGNVSKRGFAVGVQITQSGVVTMV